MLEPIRELRKVSRKEEKPKYKRKRTAQTTGPSYPGNKVGKCYPGVRRVLRVRGGVLTTPTVVSCGLQDQGAEGAGKAQSAECLLCIIYVMKRRSNNAECDERPRTPG